MQKKQEEFSVLFLQSQQEAGKFSKLSEPLEEKGCWVDMAQHIEEANRFLDHRSYDMLLMDISDISMGECLNLISRLRKLKTNLVVISDHLDSKWYQKAMDIGVSTIFTKPINPAQLENIVDQYKRVRSS
jgi:DNA-binding NtrC family response regulator